MFKATKAINRLKTLSNNCTIPSIGLGLSPFSCPFPDLPKLIIEAAKVGFRHFDTADAYNNYGDIKQALKVILKTIKREDLFITTKVVNNPKTIPEDDLKRGLEEIGLNYFDLTLIHWPHGPHPIHKLWENLEKCVDKGYTHSLGTASFNVQSLHDLSTYAKIKPVCNQIEYHVYLQQDALLDYCQKQAIQVVAWSPFCSGGVQYDDQKQLISPFKDKTLINLSKKYNKSVAQLMLGWMIQKGIIPIPKTTKIQNLKTNFDSFFQIDEEDFQSINLLNRQQRMYDLSNFDCVKQNLFI